MFGACKTTAVAWTVMLSLAIPCAFAQGAPGTLPGSGTTPAAITCSMPGNAQPAAFRDGVFKAGDISLAFTEGPKTGPTIVFLPGMAVPRQSYIPAARLLCGRFHVVLVDQRGQGESSWAPDGRYRVIDYGADITAFIKTQLGGAPVIISGHSLGGLVALWLAANHPELVAGVNAEDNPFLMSEAARWKTHWVKPMFIGTEQRLRAYQDSGRDPNALVKAYAAERMVLPRQDVPYVQRIRALGKLLSNMSARGVVAADAAEQARLDQAYRAWLDGKPVTNAEFMPRAVLAAMAKTRPQVDPNVPHYAVTAELNDHFNHREAMTKVQAPVLYWNSDQDLVGVLDQVEHDENARIMGANARMHHVVAHGVGHLIHNEQPEFYAREIADFFLAH